MILGGVVNRNPFPGQSVTEVLQIPGRVGGPVQTQNAAVVCQERIRHQGADQRPQADEEVQSLRKHKERIFYQQAFLYESFKVL